MIENPYLIGTIGSLIAGAIIAGVTIVCNSLRKKPIKSVDASQLLITDDFYNYLSKETAGWSDEVRKEVFGKGIKESTFLTNTLRSVLFGSENESIHASELMAEYQENLSRKGKGLILHTCIKAFDYYKGHAGQADSPDEEKNVNEFMQKLFLDLIILDDVSISEYLIEHLKGKKEEEIADVFDYAKLSLAERVRIINGLPLDYQLNYELNPTGDEKVQVSSANPMPLSVRFPTKQDHAVYSSFVKHGTESGYSTFKAGIGSPVSLMLGQHFQYGEMEMYSPQEKKTFNGVLTASNGVNTRNCKVQVTKSHAGLETVSFTICDCRNLFELSIRVPKFGMGSSPMPEDGFSFKLNLENLILDKHTEDVLLVISYMFSKNCFVRLWGMVDGNAAYRAFGANAKISATDAMVQLCLLCGSLATIERYFNLGLSIPKKFTYGDVEMAEELALIIRGETQKIKMSFDIRTDKRDEFLESLLASGEKTQKFNLSANPTEVEIADKIVAVPQYEMVFDSIKIVARDEVSQEGEESYFLYHAELVEPRKAITRLRSEKVANKNPSQRCAGSEP